MNKIDYKNYRTPTDYMSFDKGQTRIRVISSGGMMLEHGIRTAGRFIILGECKGEGCDLCAKNGEPKLTYIWIVIDRDHNEIKVLKKGKGFGDKLAKLGKLYGDPQDYDIMILNSGEGRESKYEIKKSGDEPFSTEEQSLVNLKKPILIQKYFTKN